jgi:hypothetical protein
LAAVCRDFPSPRDIGRERVTPNKLCLTARAEIVVAIDVVAPPCRERFRRSTGTEDRKGQDEEYRETGTIPCAGDQVSVVAEDAGVVVSKVELLEEPGNKLAEDDASLGRVVRDVAGVLNKLGEVDLVEREASNLGDDLRALRVSRGKCKVYYQRGEELHVHKIQYGGQQRKRRQ